MPLTKSEHSRPVVGTSLMNNTAEHEQQECHVHYLIACPICDTSWQSLSTIDKEKLLGKPAPHARYSTSNESGAKLQQNQPLITPIGYHDDYPVFPVLASQSSRPLAASQHVLIEDGSETDSSSDDEMQEVNQSRIVVLGQPEVRLNHRLQHFAHLICGQSSTTRRMLSEELEVQVNRGNARFAARHVSDKHYIYIASSSVRNPGSGQSRFGCALQWANTTENGPMDSYAFTLEQPYNPGASSETQWSRGEVRALLAALQIIDWAIECRSLVVITSSYDLLQNIRAMEDRRAHYSTSIGDVLGYQGDADLWQLIYNDLISLGRHGCSVDVVLACREDPYHVNVASLATVQARRAWTDTAHFPACSPIRPVLLS